MKFERLALPSTTADGLVSAVGLRRRWHQRFEFEREGFRPAHAFRSHVRDGVRVMGELPPTGPRYGHQLDGAGPENGVIVIRMYPVGSHVPPGRSGVERSGGSG